MLLPEKWQVCIVLAENGVPVAYPHGISLSVETPELEPLSSCRRKEDSNLAGGHRARETPSKQHVRNAAGPLGLLLASRLRPRLGTHFRFLSLGSLEILMPLAHLRWLFLTF